METTAAFRLSGNATLTAAAVTRRLAIQPTRAFEAGDPVSSRSAATRQGSLWLRFLTLPGDLWLDVCGDGTEH